MLRRAAKGYTCHTPISQPCHTALPRAIPAIHTPIPQPSHTMLPRAMPAIHPFHRPTTPRCQGLYLPYIHPFHSPPTPCCQGLCLPYTHSTALPHRAAKGYTCHTYTHSTALQPRVAKGYACHTAIPQPSETALPRDIPAIHHSTDLPPRATKGYTCHTRIPQPSHTVLPRDIPALHPFHRPATPRFQGLYLPYTIPQPSHTALPRAIPAIHPFHRPTTPRCQGLYLPYTSSTALPHRATKGYTCHTPLPQPSHSALPRASPAIHPSHRPATPRCQGLHLTYVHPFHSPPTLCCQGLYLPYTHSTDLPHRAAKGCTCHTPFHSPPTPHCQELFLPYTHITSLPHRAAKGYTCHTPIPQPSHTTCQPALPRAIPDIRTPIPQPSHTVLPRAIPAIHPFHSPPTPRCQGLYLTYTHSTDLPHRAAKGCTCHTPFHSPPTPRCQGLYLPYTHSTALPHRAAKGYTCHTPIPQPSHTALPRAIPDIHPFHRPTTPRCQGLYLPYTIPQPSHSALPRAIPAIHPFHSPATPRCQGLYLPYTHSTALPHCAAKGYTCHTPFHRPTTPRCQGLYLPYTHFIALPHRATKGSIQRTEWLLSRKNGKTFQVILSSSKFGVLNIRANVSGIIVDGLGTTSLTMSSRSLAHLNRQLEFVVYVNTVFDIDARDFASDINEKVTIITKTFLRYPSVKLLLQSIHKYYPKMRVVVADDGRPIQDLQGTSLQGWFGGRNLGVSQVTTPYLLWVDDDFIFTEATKLEVMVDILDNSNLDVVSGICGGGSKRLYAARLSVIPGEHDNDGVCISEKLGKNYGQVHGFPDCFLTTRVTNFFMGRTDGIRSGDCDRPQAREKRRVQKFRYGRDIANFTKSPTGLRPSGDPTRGRADTSGNTEYPMLYFIFILGLRLRSIRMFWPVL
ncbi:Beta-1,4 N-acetylgalactosaminyltransferase 1 [Branchiostoma belcheri]|nr:Beta-1,4 N-acetylgalactosaminyltransferase 1 [Branchiostoma belcheri]